MTIRILLVDDHSVVRQGLRMFLSLDPALEVVGEASNGAEGIEQVRRLKPDVVLMDLVMPVMDGITAIQQLRNEAHRFGITFHRDKRSKAAIQTSIETIPGIGEKTMLTLIKHFKSVKRLKLATEKEISDIVGLSKAKKITDFYKTN